jgi:hypothetical protein
MGWVARSFINCSGCHHVITCSGDGSRGHHIITFGRDYGRSRSSHHPITCLRGDKVMADSRSGLSSYQGFGMITFWLFWAEFAVRR